MVHSHLSPLSLPIGVDAAVDPAGIGKCLRSVGLEGEPELDRGPNEEVFQPEPTLSNCNGFDIGARKPRHKRKPRLGELVQAGSIIQFEKPK